MNDPFLVIGVIGLIVLVFTVAFDGVLDVFGGEPVFPATAFFAAIFGFSSVLTHESEMSSSMAILLPIVISILFTGVFFSAFRFLKRHAEKDELYVPNPQSMLGQPARVNYWEFLQDGGGSKGEVITTFRGQPRKVQAVSDETFVATQTVYVTKVISESQVEVSSKLMLESKES